MIGTSSDQSDHVLMMSGSGDVPDRTITLLAHAPG
jgi:hypothetical protein